MDISDTSSPLRPFFSGFTAFTLEGQLKKNSTKELHLHENHQILRCRSGISLLLDEHRQVPLFHRMTAFIPARCPHRSIVLGRQVEYKSLYIHPSLFSVNCNGIRVFDMSELGIALLGRIDCTFFAGQEERGDSSLQRDCLRLFLRILRQDLEHPAPLACLPVASSPQNRTIISYIEKQYAEKIELQDFGRLLPCTLRHISRTFKAELNISIFDYLRIYRILQASIQLQTTDATITEIAFACGYNSISSFFKDFNLIFSVTPRQFRMRHEISPLE